MCILRALPLIWLLFAPWANAATYQEADDFLAEVFAGAVPEPSFVWLSGAVKERTSDILGHPYGGLRIRYWGKDARTVWILEEIGKERPITVGHVIDAGRMELVRVLAFRESRGYEVRHPSFTDQFRGIGLSQDYSLDRDIDGISGATLSVRALTQLAALALYLHGQTPYAHAPSQTAP